MGAQSPTAPEAKEGGPTRKRSLNRKNGTALQEKPCANASHAAHRESTPAKHLIEQERKKGKKRRRDKGKKGERGEERRREGEKEREEGERAVGGVLLGVVA
ncbi:unnamed protein product [Polarella glacialis]|uniref:Uncharacterized protein n=1 Tax=Polarella glacialis TaxID=89957 RepID=A0A813FVK0_POLGL|nr:unnamed protein product [Polarella glacialis]CAE8653175.1 unnamed protein product [Polarella glacialis]CAE8726335.1 unnamed protein product [Polarella glacialis]